MIDFTSVKNNLLEISDLPNINDLIKNREWGSIIEELNSIGDDEFGLRSFIKNKRIKIFNILFSAPSGISLSIKENRRLIILIILVLDELEFYSEGEHWREYVEFRYKAFSLFIDHDHDVEAAKLYKDLDEMNSGSNGNSIVKSRLKNQKKVYKRKISHKIKELEIRKQFDKAGFLNSMYGTVPSYIYEPRIEDKEKKHFEWHFLEPVYKIIIDGLFILFLYGLNLWFIKHYENGNLFTYLAKGNFDIYDLLFGLVLIFFIFWLFKVFDSQIINNLWKNIVKGLTFLFAFILINVLIIDRYNNEFEKYFPDENDKEVIKGTYNDEKIRVLVTKFMPIKKTTIFNKDYSDVNISQLFYKKMLENKMSDSSTIKRLFIDYSEQSFNITAEEEFRKYRDNRKYDFVIGGDFFDNNNEIFLCNSCYIVNYECKSLLKNFKNGKFNSDPNDDFIVLYYNDPFFYYKIIFNQNKYIIDSTLCFDINNLTQTEYDIQKNFPNDFSFISKIEISPIIAFNYFRVLIDWKNFDKQQASNINAALDSTIGYINNIQSICPNIDSSFIKNSHENIELQIHLLLLKAYFINKKILLTHTKKNYNITKEELGLWFQKTNCFADALKISAQYRHVNEMDVDYLMTSYWFNSYNKIANELNLQPSLENPEVDSIEVAENPFRLTYQRQCTRSVMKEIDAQIQRYGMFGDAKFKSEDFFEIYSEMKKHIKKYYRE